MITYERLSKRPKVFSRLVGVTVEEFEELHDTFKSFWDAFVYETFIKGKKRKREYGGGNTETIETSRDKLLFILMYIRLYPIQILQGLWFGIDESVACRWIHRLTPLLEKTLGFKNVLPKHTGSGRPRGRTLEEIVEEFPDLKGFLMDGTEQPVRRPKDKEKQKTAYSGKKKRHTKKNIVLTDAKRGYVHFLGKTQKGTMHDKAAADEENLNGTSDVDIGTDLGFIGYHAGSARIIHPVKKSKGKELPEHIKEQNKVFSRIRIVVEHALSGVKRSRIAADIYRNIREGFDDRSMLVAVGLHNFRVTHRYAT